MGTNPKRFIFKPAWLILVAVVSAVTIIIPSFEFGVWLTESFPAVLWGVILALVLGLLFFGARVSALNQALLISVRDSTTHSGDSSGAKEIAPMDRDIAEVMWAVASDKNVLTTLDSFYEYQISRESVRVIADLARLPRIRRPYDPELKEWMLTLAISAQDWDRKLSSLCWLDGDYYSTRLKDLVSDESYQRHSAEVDELVAVGDLLHSQLLGYQAFYASLGIEATVPKNGS